MTDKMKNLVTRTLTGIVFVAVMVGSVWVSRWTFLALLAVVGVGCFVEFLRLVKPNFLAVIAGLIYIFLPLGLLLWGCFSDFGYDVWKHFVLFLLIVIWANDVFAYLTGVTVGRHKLAPKISPKKTWEGFAGGVVGAVAAGMLLAGGNWNSVAAAGAAVVIAVSGVAGDLFESWLKRRADVKDSGNVLPGHGGFLDRFDSLLFAAPAAAIYMYIYFEFVLL